MTRNLLFLIFFIAVSYASASHKKEGCPKNLVLCDNECVKSCSLDKNRKIINNSEKVCPGVDRVTLSNIDSFIGCNIINGSITIAYGDGKRNSVNPKVLQIFNSVKRITGYLKLIGATRLMQDSSIFKSLEVIEGNELVDGSYSFVVNKTSLSSFSLKSLKQISAGDIYIKDNVYLCYVHTIAWNVITKSSSQKVHTDKNNNEINCEFGKSLCHHECSSQGCWDSGPGQCVSCKNVKDDGICVPACPLLSLYNNKTQTTEKFSTGKYTYKGECLSACPENTWALDTTCVHMCPYPKQKGTNECTPGPFIFTKGFHDK